MINLQPPQGSAVGGEVGGVSQPHERCKVEILTGPSRTVVWGALGPRRGVEAYWDAERGKRLSMFGASGAVRGLQVPGWGS